MHETTHRTPRGIVIPAHAMTWQFDRAGGPGGQHVNKTSSRATLHIDIASLDADEVVAARLAVAFGHTLTVSDATTPSQWRNRQQTLRRACDELDRAAAPPPAQRTPTRPSRASNTRRLAAKRRRGDRLRGRSQFDD
jgi:ribosome-associated protein